MACKRKVSSSSFPSRLYKSPEGRSIGPATLSNGAERPRIKCQPQNWNYAFAKERVLLTIQATGSEPLQYYWEWRPPGEGHGWHALSYDINKTHGTDTPTLVISNVQKSDEGSYQCTVSNCAGSETSQSAILEISVAESPRIVSQPCAKNCSITGKEFSFTVKATGAEPLSYHWKRIPVVANGDNLPSRFQGADTATMTIDSVQRSDEGSYQCTVTNCAGSETSDSAVLITVEAANVPDLVNELSGVVRWIPLGIFLGVHYSVLQAIEVNYKKVEDCRLHVLFEWSNLTDPTWVRVVQALMNMNEKGLAAHLSSKYGVSLLDTGGIDKPLEALKTCTEQEQITDSLVAACKHNDNMHELERQLSLAQSCFKASIRESQSTVNDKSEELLGTLSKLREEVQQVTQERNAIQGELKHKQRECELLEELRDMYKKKRKKKEKFQELQEMVDGKEKEIQKLKGDLQEKTRELKSLREEAITLKMKLAELTTEVQTKSEQIQQLQREKDDLTKSYNSERAQANMLLQNMVTKLDSHESYINEMQLQLSDVEHETEQQLTVYSSKNDQLEEHIRDLSLALEEREATLTTLREELKSQKSVAVENEDRLFTIETEILAMQVKLLQANSQKQQQTNAAMQETLLTDVVWPLPGRYLPAPGPVTELSKSVSKPQVEGALVTAVPPSSREPIIIVPMQKSSVVITAEETPFYNEMGMRLAKECHTSLHQLDLTDRIHFPQLFSRLLLDQNCEWVFLIASHTLHQVEQGLDHSTNVPVWQAMQELTTATYPEDLLSKVVYVQPGAPSRMTIETPITTILIPSSPNTPDYTGTQCADEILKDPKVKRRLDRKTAGPLLLMPRHLERMPHGTTPGSDSHHRREVEQPGGDRARENEN